MFPPAGLAILHGCIAAAFVEGLLRVWRVRAPAQRLALRFAALLAPFVLPPAFAALAPFRSTAAFATDAALFAGAHWDTLTPGGVGAATIATAALAATGVALFLRDAIPFLADRVRGDRHDPPLPPDHPAWTRLPAPPAIAVRLTAAADAVLYCSGIDRPAVTVSLGTLVRLDDDELAAALQHEIEHARRRDPALGWLLMLLRALQAFNPATQIVGRQIVQEVEHRADRAVADLGMGPALARAIAKVSGSGATRSDLADPSTPARFASAARRAVSNAVLARCEGLLADTQSVPDEPGPARVALAALAISLLLFFVV